MKATALKVMRGEILVGKAYVEATGPRVAMVVVGLESKHAKVDGTTGGDGDGPGVCLMANRNTINICAERAGMATCLEFPAFKGYEVAVARVSKYTLTACLYKPRCR